MFLKRSRLRALILPTLPSLAASRWAIAVDTKNGVVIKRTHGFLSHVDFPPNSGYMQQKEHWDLVEEFAGVQTEDNWQSYVEDRGLCD